MTPPKGYFVLHPYAVPALPAGAYTLHGEHDLGDAALPTAPLDSHIVVTAPRFTMPPDQILSTFPPANAEGGFRDRLPQIVLKRRTLPWDRSAPAPDDHTPPVPWLALVVIAEGEGSLSGEVPVTQCTTAGVVLEPPHDVPTSVYIEVPQTTVDGVFPTLDDLTVLSHVREVDLADTELAMGDDDGFLAVVLANRLPQPGVDADGTLIPRKYLACLINLEGQYDVLPKPLPEVDLVDHFDALAVVEDLRVDTSALVTNPDAFTMGTAAFQVPHAIGAGRAGTARALDATAATGTGQTASAAAKSWAPSPRDIESVAVSAAPDEVGRLVRDQMSAGFRIPAGVLAVLRTYRFPVLAHWSFTVSADGTFETYMRGLDVGLLGSVPATAAATDPNVLPAPPSSRPPAEFTETGHIGLPHQTRRGDHVRAWYRGPLVPSPTTREQRDGQGNLPFAHTGDQLRATVPDGREDVSLAAGFEIGRLLALSQPSVVAAMARWRRDSFGAEAARRLAQQAASADIFANTLQSGQSHDLGRLLGRDLLLAAAANPDTVLAPTRPPTDPGRPLDLPDGDLGKVVADGLGFSIDRVRKLANGLGVSGALRQTAVPVSEQAPADPAAPDLHAALDVAISRLAADVLRATPGPNPGPQPGPAAPGAGGDRGPDVLDELLGEDR